MAENEVNDASVLSLSNVMVNTQSLRSLDLCGNEQITVVGWHSLFLQISHCILDSLINLYVIEMNDAVINLLTNESMNNIVAWGWRSLGLQQEWSAFSNVLCSRSNIMSTFRSNHIPQDLCRNENEMGLQVDDKLLLQFQS